MRRLLISILWITSLVLVAAWFFNTMFGFNLLAASHWRYLSELQVMGAVDPLFYIAVAVFLTAGLVGLYILIVPWHRHIKMESPKRGLNTMSKFDVKKVGSPESAPVRIGRPPKLNLGSGAFIPTAHEDTALQEQTVAFRAPEPDVRQAPPTRSDIKRQSQALVETIGSLLATAGFIMKNPPTVGDIRPDLWGIASGEALLIGIVTDNVGDVSAQEGGDATWQGATGKFKSPVWQMTSVIQKVQALFLEVLEPELKINILPFVFVDGRVGNRPEVQNIWNALGVKVFDDMGELSEFLNGHRPRSLDESETGDFNAFVDFINTVTNYFDGGA